MFKTNKCNHGDKGMCINCLLNKQKQINKGLVPQKQVTAQLTCKHAPHMKCLRCLPKDQPHKSLCQHPDYQKCKHCQWLVRYEKFRHYLQNLQMSCMHKKPCQKCVPPLSRKTFFIDKFCKKHLPYPQAQCDSCMAPTLTVGTQKYAHVFRVVIKTTSIYRIMDARVFGILLGRVIDDVVIIEDVYFPAEQEAGSCYINPDLLADHSHIWDYLNLQEVGLLYHSNQITGLGLMLSSLFQQKYMRVENGHQISKFITMRLQLGTQQSTDPHFQCFMVSDQLQAFHKNNIIYEKQTYDNYFDLITAKSQHLSELPTFLREGIQTDKLYFKQALVWIETISQQNFFEEGSKFNYPFFTIEAQYIEQFKKYVQLQIDPLQKYRNIQFLLHLEKLIGQQSMVWFINNYLPFDPDLYLRQKLPLLEKIEHEKLKMIENSTIYENDM